MTFDVQTPVDVLVYITLLEKDHLGMQEKQICQNGEEYFIARFMHYEILIQLFITVAYYLVCIHKSF